MCMLIMRFNKNVILTANKNYFLNATFYLKSAQYKKLVPNAMQFTYQNLKSCKPHEKNP